MTAVIQLNMNVSRSCANKSGKNTDLGFVKIRKDELKDCLTILLAAK